MTCATPWSTGSLFPMETTMNEKSPPPAKPIEHLHFRINQIEVLACGRFTVVIVVAAILLAILLG